jgi:hypothetical protein
MFLSNRASEDSYGVFWGMCGESSRNVFLLLFMVLWVPISAMLCMRAMLMLWHAFLFLGLRFFYPFISLLGGLCCFGCKNLKGKYSPKAHFQYMRA